MKPKPKFTIRTGSTAYGPGTALSVEGVLDQIEVYLASRDSWIESNHLDTAAKYQHKAETLVELLEVNLCGSTGGYAPDQPSMSDLAERYLWLKEYYGSRTKARSASAITVCSLQMPG